MHAQGTAVPSGQGTATFGSTGVDRIAYTVAEVAALLGKHSNTVYGWVRSGALPSERIGNTIYIPKWALARLQARPPGGMRRRDHPSVQALPGVRAGQAGRRVLSAPARPATVVLLPVLYSGGLA
jgi:excisionase family DNA binding protein